MKISLAGFGYCFIHIDGRSNFSALRGDANGRKTNTTQRDCSGAGEMRGSHGYECEHGSLRL
jgi:hypothetical protein